MAAVAVQAAASGRPSKRKSRRALAQSFLSNISLDGNITSETTGSCSEPNTPIRERQRSVNVEESGDNVTRPLQDYNVGSSAKPKFMHSISESAASFEKDKLRTFSTLGAREMKTLKAHDSLHRRSHSLTESTLTDCSSSSSSFSGFLHYGKGATRHKISCMTGSSFKNRRRLTDKRIVVCSSRKVPFLTYSVLKYHKEGREHGAEGSGKKRASAPNAHSICIEGVEIGTGDKTVSYSSLLVPSYYIMVKSGEKSDGYTPYSPRHDTVFEEFSFNCAAASSDYEPYILDDPELMSGKHRTVLQLSSYMVSVTAYAKPSELKKDLNERFKEKFPHIAITLTKLRSLKKDLLKIALSVECQLDLTTVAYAYVYFEKLILKGKINKPNRKLVAGSCLLLAAKFNDDRRVKTKDLIDKIEDKLKIQLKDLLGFEFQALVGLEFNLHIPSNEVLPHLKRLEAEQQ
ncbi:CDK5 and ABL1 enzyme substrate 2 [Exaiptasia diaphana]|uniref:Cyclin N-terminal domain-containing protein n=1 Tax=Exaiptasia diaphana TaxID=2652724 RepID=A0A913XTT6_EXADI|nr:CDK5 and ABL1 enzyme substrate 2 [Exaiptasia diaphana]KXJ29414.1 CDK5 and ABL1 enzyme substrate 2 [Exaiptasia diaphana]